MKFNSAVCKQLANTLEKLNSSLLDVESKKARIKTTFRLQLRYEKVIKSPRDVLIYSKRLDTNSVTFIANPCNFYCSD